MGRMKDIYTEMQTQESITNSLNEWVAKNTAENIKGISELGEIKDLPESMVAKIRRSINTNFEEAVQQKFQNAKSVLLSKHKDYGPKNISQSPGGALNGLRVRMHDKMARINHLVESGATPSHESLKDSFLDLANYAIIALLVLDEEWPNE